MKQTFFELAIYQKWANDRFRKNLKTDDFSKLTSATMPYGSIRDVSVHIFGAVELWLKRLEGVSPSSIRPVDKYTNWNDLEKDWIDFDAKLIDVVKKLDEKDFSKRFKYVSTEGKHLETTMENILLQLTTHHQSYHRGQIAMALRELKLNPVQETDYIYYVYDQKKN